MVTPEILLDVQGDKDMTIEEFNDFIANMASDVLRDISRDVLQDGKMVEDRFLYPYPDNWGEFSENDTDFVGYEINVAKDLTIAVEIGAVLPEFDAGDTVKLLLFAADKKTLIDSKEITVLEKDNTAQSLEWVLRFADHGQRFYIGYLRSSLSAKPLNRTYELSNTRNIFNALNVRPVRVSGWDSEAFFDMEDVDYVSETWGLNFRITARRDFAPVIEQNELEFSTAQQLGVGVRVLNEIATSVRSNRDERISKTQALIELNGTRDAGEPPYVVGLIQRYRQEIQRLKSQFGDPDMIQVTMR
jgi:hypothetical protein